jgi:hypothetical protein
MHQLYQLSVNLKDGWNNSVGAATRLLAGYPENRGSVPVKAEFFSCLEPTYPYKKWTLIVLTVRGTLVEVLRIKEQEFVSA